MSHSIRTTQRFTRALRTAVTGSSLALGLGACSGNVVNLGEGQTPPAEPPPSYSRCRESTTVEGDVDVTEQSQIDELEGCEVIQGGLQIAPLFNPDLRPLHALQTVTGTLFLAPPLDEVPGDVLNSMDAVMADGWLGSLEGLESLQAAGGIVLQSPAAPDLQPLSQLRRLTGNGELQIWQANNLHDLAPLSNLAGIDSLYLNGEQLESISDLQLEPRMSEIYIQGVPKLTDLGPNNQVRVLSGGLTLDGTGIRDLTAFSSLVGDGAVWIARNPELHSLAGLEQFGVSVGARLEQNPQLEDISALTGLYKADGLLIIENPRLRRIPDFPQLSVKSIEIRDNAALEAVATFTGELARWALDPGGSPDLTGTDALKVRPDSLMVRGNPLLEHYEAPTGWQGAKFLVINNNARLRDLDLGTIQALDLLSIKGNPALTQVTHALGSVDVLSVLGNPALPLDSFDAVQTFQRDMSSDPIPPPDCSRGECSY